MLLILAVGLRKICFTPSNGSMSQLSSCFVMRHVVGLIVYLTPHGQARIGFQGKFSSSFTMTLVSTVDPSSDTSNLSILHWYSVTNDPRFAKLSTNRCLPENDTNGSANMQSSSYASTSTAPDRKYDLSLSRSIRRAASLSVWGGLLKSMLACDCGLLSGSFPLLAPNIFPNASTAYHDVFVRGSIASCVDFLLSVEEGDSSLDEVWRREE